MIIKHALTGIIFTFAPMLIIAETGIPKNDQAFIYGLTLSGILIVLFALTLVAATVALMSRIIRFITGMNGIKKTKIINHHRPDETDDSIPAIVAALHMEMRSLQEEEKAILTIRKVIKPFSGWNNKALIMRNPQMQ
ncbi:MAG: OadG family protein [FCB group bacterium]|nr:OadG family protein [FCB group bacterium]